MGTTSFLRFIISTVTLFIVTCCRMWEQRGTASLGARTRQSPSTPRISNWFETGFASRSVYQRWVAYPEHMVPPQQLPRGPLGAPLTCHCSSHKLSAGCHRENSKEGCSWFGNSSRVVGEVLASSPSPPAIPFP